MPVIRSGFFIFALSLLVLWESFRAGIGTLKEPGSGFLSFCAGLVLFGLSLIELYRGWRLRESQKTFSRRVILALICLFIYSLVLDKVGFVVATFFLVGILFHLNEPRRWWVLLGMTLLVTFLAYFVFGVLLHVYFPRSFLGI